MNKNFIYLPFILTIILIFSCKESSNPGAPPISTNRSRNGIFLHHSTGECIWGPNGSNTSVPQEVSAYNNSHGFTGNNAFNLSETWFPNNPGDNNEWERWHRIFENRDPNAVITTYYNTYGIIMIKSCFPSSAIESIGQPSDTLEPTLKTIYNYKWHWRHIINAMRAQPNIFFVIWTNAPLVEAETNPTQAALSRQFCIWAKDTLAQGLDPVFGQFPRNVYVFDFFRKLTDSNGFMLLQYATAYNDSHPNAAATQLVAPQLVQEIFNAYLSWK